jgi:hypothetical protein
MKKLLLISAILSTALFVTGCEDDAVIAKNNAAKAADNFEVNRRILFYNTWTDTVVQKIEGLCAIEYGHRVSVICKVGEDSSGNAIVKNSMISTSGQTEVVVEQLDALPVNVYHYRRTFKPQGIIPDVDFKGSKSALVESLSTDKKD